MPFDVSFGSLTHATGAAVLHFIWQGAAVGVLAAAVLAIIPRRCTHARYLTACGAMSLCLLLFMGTVLLGVVSVQPSSGAVSMSEDFLAAAVRMTAGATVNSARMIHTITWVYLVGVVFFAIRFGIQWLVAKRLTLRGVSQPDDTWGEIFETLKRELGVSPKVRLLRSALAEVPMVVSWISPVVLVPVSAFTSLSPDQLRAVLTHELAHIRRRDHLFNAVQLVLEAVLFFHPVTWWLSRQVRAEREHCCDDATVRTAVNPRVFAEALAQLELVRNSHQQAALAATGGPLMDRIARILGVNSRPRRTPAWRTGIAIAAGALVAAAGMTHAATKDPEPRNPEVLQMLQQIATIGEADNQQIRDLYDMFVFDSTEINSKAWALRDRINAAVQAGEITPAEADKKLEAAEGKMSYYADMQFLQDVFMYTPGEAYLVLSEDRMEEAVRLGELTQEQADAKLDALAMGHAKKTAHMEAVRAKLDAMVQAGELTREQADAKLDGMSKLQAKKPIDVEAVRAKLDAMVQAGELTREQADAKLDGMSKLQAKTPIDVEAVRAKLDAMVQTGEMTREQADAKLNGMSKLQRTAVGD